jgi:hypothetical protein
VKINNTLPVSSLIRVAVPVNCSVWTSLSSCSQTFRARYLAAPASCAGDSDAMVTVGRINEGLTLVMQQS